MSIGGNMPDCLLVGLLEPADDGPVPVALTACNRLRVRGVALLLGESAVCRGLEASCARRGDAAPAAAAAAADDDDDDLPSWRPPLGSGRRV